jgi:hypothetical protein
MDDFKKSDLEPTPDQIRKISMTYQEFNDHLRELFPEGLHKTPKTLIERNKILKKLRQQLKTLTKFGFDKFNAESAVRKEPEDEPLLSQTTKSTPNFFHPNYVLQLKTSWLSKIIAGVRTHRPNGAIDTIVGIGTGFEVVNGELCIEMISAGSIIQSIPLKGFDLDSIYTFDLYKTEFEVDTL